MQVGTIVQYLANNAKIYWKPEEDAIGIIISRDNVTQCRVMWNDGRDGWYLLKELEVICK